MRTNRRTCGLVIFSRANGGQRPGKSIDINHYKTHNVSSQNFRLNEGFARYFQFFGTKMISAYADWDLEEQFVVENLQQSMQLDSTDDTHAMTDPSVSTKAQASKIFDNISYNKAASIIRMLSHYITLAKFQTTLQLYLDKK